MHKVQKNKNKTKLRCRDCRSDVEEVKRVYRQTKMFNRLDLGGGISGCRISQALRICSGAFKSLVTAMQVEMGEMSFQSRRDKLTQECYEHSKSNLYSDLYIQKAITESPVIHLFCI